MSLPTSKFIGTTEVCFDHFLEANPRLEAVELIAEFCLPNAKGAVTSVQNWQRRAIQFPRGDALLRLRCFLTLAGYDVTEFLEREGIVREVAMAISVGSTTPQKVADKLGSASGDYNLHSLWQITLAKQGVSDKVREDLKLLVGSSRRKVRERTKKWRERILVTVGQPPTVEVVEQETDLQAMLMPVVATSFGRSVTALTPMVQALLKAEQPQAVRDATRDGASIDELIEALTALRKSL